MNYLKNLSKKLVILKIFLLFFIVPAYAAHYSFTVPSTPNSMGFYGDVFTIEGETAQAGDEIAVFDSQGTICGHYVVTNAGFFNLSVYGEDSGTAGDQGADINEDLIFKVWDDSAGLEITLENSMYIQKDVFGQPQIETIPPKFLGSNEIRGMGIAAVIPETDPTIDIIFPVKSYTTGGGTLEITGTNFVDGLSITFGEEAALNIIFDTETHVSCTIPEYETAGEVSIILANPEGDPATVTFIYEFPPPEILSVDPSEVYVNESVPITILGSNFQQGLTITLAGNDITEYTFTEDKLIFTSPSASPGMYDITVTNPDGKEVILEDALEYENPAPEIISVQPSKGHIDGNIPVTILGNNFQQGLVIKIAENDITEYTFSENQVTFINPSNAANIVDITVTNPDGKNTMLEGAFEYKEIISKFDILSQTTGKAPFTVVLEDSSIGDVEEWFWHYGDDTEYRAESDTVNLEFTAPGVYPITLHVINDSDSDISEAIYITVTQYDINVDFFTPSETFGAAPLTVEFTNESFTGPLNVNSWLWNFGDGETSDAMSPTHTYNSVGIYTVSLTAEIDTLDEPISYTEENLITVVQRQLSGRIINAANEGIANCEVVLDVPGKNIPIPSVTTNENGYYTFSILPPEDEFHVAAYPSPAGPYFPTDLPELISTIDGDMSDIEITLYTGMINGKVQRATSGEGIPGIEISLIKDDDEVAHAVSSPEGNYTMTGIPDGEYYLNAWFQSIGTEVFYVEGGTTSSLSQAQMITITDEHTKTTPRTADFILADGTTISGKVVFENENPAPGILVNAWSDGLMIGGNATTNEEGLYTITGLTPVPPEAGNYSKYIVDINPEGYPYQAYMLVGNPEEATRVDAPNTEINFKIKSGHFITGTVSVESGSAQNIEVAARSHNARIENFTLTDSEGNYTLVGLPPADDYIVFAHAQDYPVQFYDGTDSEEQAKEIDLSFNDAQNINFSMNKGSRITGTVSGGSFDPENNNIWVHVSSNSTGTGGSVPTDTNGRYEIVGLDAAANDYIIFIFDPQFGQAYYKDDGTTVYSYKDLNSVNGVPVGVSPSDEDRNIVLQTSFYSIKGKVTYNNLPVSGIQIEAWSENNGHWQTCFSVSHLDSSGANYVLSGLISGTYEIGIISDKYVLSNSQMVTITDTDIKGVNLSIMKPDRTISGTIANLGSGSIVWISAVSQDADFVREIQVAGNGENITYTIPGLKPAADYVIELHAMDYPDIIYNAKTNWFQADRVDILKGNKSDINFTMSADIGKISGSIRVPDGAEAGDEIWVDAFSESERSNGAAMVKVATSCNETGGCIAGTYSINGLKKADDYVVIVNSEKYQTIFYDGQQTFNDITLVDISSTDQTDIDFSINAGYYISGYVKDTNGSGISNIDVEAWSDSKNSFGVARTDANGYFKIDGLSSSNDFIVQAFKTDEPPFIYKKDEKNTRDISFATAVEAVSSGETTVEIVIETGYEISGVVKDATGKGIKGIVVAANSQTGSTNNYDITDASGNYTIKGLPGNRTYNVAVEPGPAQSYVRQEKTVTIDEDIEMDFTLNSGCQVSGTIRNESLEPIAEAGIFFRSETTGYDEWVSSNQEGKYIFKGVPTGSDYIMMVETSSDYLIKNISDISIINTTTTMNITLTSSAEKIRGYIYKSDGKTGLSNVNIQVYSDSQDFQRFDIYTNTKGYYEVNGLPSSTDYVITAIPASDSGYAKDSVSDKKPGDDVNITLPTGGTITGVVQTAAGTKLENVFVTLTSDYLNITDEITRTDVNGLYAFYAMKSSPTSDYVVTIYPEDQGYPVTERTGLNVDTNLDNPTSIDFNLTKGNQTTISGTVKNGETIATNVKVLIYKNDIRIVSVLVDENGAFEFTALNSTATYKLKFTTRDKTLNHYSAQDGSSVESIDNAYSFSTGSVVNFVY